MKLTDQQLDDFIKLAQTRCEAQVRSVTQLMEDGPQVYVLSIFLAVAMIRGCAELLQDGMHRQNGKRPTDANTLHHVIGDVLDGLKVEWSTKVVKKKSQQP